jgi:hypothetical protein
MRLGAAIAIAALLVPAPVLAQLREMRQVIHGMD